MTIITKNLKKSTINIKKKKILINLLIVVQFQREENKKKINRAADHKKEGTSTVHVVKKRIEKIVSEEILNKFIKSQII
jgi:hypothetical protein